MKRAHAGVIGCIYLFVAGAESRAEQVEFSVQVDHPVWSTQYGISIADQLSKPLRSQLANVDWYYFGRPSLVTLSDVSKWVFKSDDVETALENEIEGLPLFLPRSVTELSYGVALASLGFRHSNVIPLTIPVTLRDGDETTVGTLHRLVDFEDVADHQSPESLIESVDPAPLLIATASDHILKQKDRYMTNQPEKNHNYGFGWTSQPIGAPKKGGTLDAVWLLDNEEALWFGEPRYRYVDLQILLLAISNQRPGEMRSVIKRFHTDIGKANPSQFAKDLLQIGVPRARVDEASTRLDSLRGHGVSALFDTVAWAHGDTVSPPLRELFQNAKTDKTGNLQAQLAQLWKEQVSQHRWRIKQPVIVGSPSSPRSTISSRSRTRLRN